MNTEKLFYQDAYMQCFEAEVLSCAKTEKGWGVVLDATAFFPEEGGQSADTGSLGGVRVLDAKEKSGIIIHYTDGPLPVGQRVSGRIDWSERFRKMQTHTGEHIVSGIVHARYGYENVGFHLGDNGCTFDFDGELTREQVDEIELLANEVVWKNVPVTARFPASRELQQMEYRSKLELTENVRIVTIEGVDTCACCAPHVASTGQIGVIKLLDLMRHRGGVRIWCKCGADALEDYRARYTASAAISALLNTPQESIAAGVEKLMAQRDVLKGDFAALKRQVLEEQAAGLASTEGNILLFAQEDDGGMRILVNGGMEKCGGVCAVFSGEDGAWQFVMGSRTVDMRAFIKEHGPALKARGGGQSQMVSGRCQATKAELEDFFDREGRCVQ